MTKRDQVAKVRGELVPQDEPDAREEALIPGRDMGFTMSPQEMDDIDLDELDLEAIATVAPEGGGPRVVAPWLAHLQKMIADQHRLQASRQELVGKVIDRALPMPAATPLEITIENDRAERARRPE